MTAPMPDRPVPAEMREYRRYALDLVGELYGGELAHPCHIYDLSAGGAELQVTTADAVPGLPEIAVIDIPLLGRYRASRVWQSGRAAGYAFALDPAARTAFDALLAHRFGS
ncbi:hypothetical protein HKCCSP123_19620 [Rhodobacterales bacterium HKCCSP123]|nr:hypothetical protein [Rhodobacterales bacterium HKCCSP123]